jgi:hypothetical protein
MDNSNSANGLPPRKNMLTRAGIQTALGRDARKQVERGLSCTRSQAWRMVYHGEVPGRFRAALVRLLEEAISRNQAELSRLDAELKAIAHAEMVARAAERRAETVGQGAPVLPGLDKRTT